MEQKTKRTLIRIGAAFAFIVVVIWIMSILETVTALIMVSLGLAYILDPAVDWLETKRLSRPFAIMLLFLGVFAFVILLVLYIVPGIIREVSTFVSNAPTYFSKLQGHLTVILGKLDIQLPTTWEDVYSIIHDRWKEIVPKISNMANPVGKAIAGVFASALGFVAALLYLVLIPVLTYYFLDTFDDMKKGIANLIPVYARDSVLDKLHEMDLAVAGFIRGQIIICLILAFLYSLGFVIIGIDLAIVLGTTGGLLFIIPYVGTAIALVGGIVMALAQGDVLAAVWVVLWIAVVQAAEGYILTPKIVGEKVGLHPVAYIIALMVGAKLLGFVGMLIAIPLAAAIKVMLSAAVEVYMNSELYRDHKAIDP